MTAGDTILHHSASSVQGGSMMKTPTLTLDNKVQNQIKIIDSIKSQVSFKQKQAKEIKKKPKADQTKDIEICTQSDEDM